MSTSCRADADQADADQGATSQRGEPLAQRADAPLARGFLHPALVDFLARWVIDDALRGAADGEPGESARPAAMALEGA